MPTLFSVEGRNGEYFTNLHRLSSRNTEFGDDGEVTNIARVKLPRGTDPQAVSDAIRYSAYGERCGHEHDCCGCYFVSSVSTKQVAKRELIVEMRYCRNI